MVNNLFAWKHISFIWGLGSAGLLLTPSMAIAKEVCEPLLLVGGQGSQVEKTVSQPSIPSPIPGVKLANNNWNTDWAVPTLKKFDYFLATIQSDGGTFDIRFYVKYNNQTASEAFNEKGVVIPADKPLVIKAMPDPNEDPYQVNLFNGGLDRIGNSYTASVVGCTK